MLNKLMFGVFELFILFVAVFVLVTTFITHPLGAFLLFGFLIYFVYYLAIKYFID